MPLYQIRKIASLTQLGGRSWGDQIHHSALGQPSMESVGQAEVSHVVFFTCDKGPFLSPYYHQLYLSKAVKLS